MGAQDSKPRTINDFLISFSSDMNRGIDGSSPVPAIFNSIPLTIQTKQQAYRTAAWILELCESLPDEKPASSFEEVRRAVENT